MDILVEIVEALERDAVPAEIRIASILDRIRCLRSPSTGSRSLSLLAVEAYERGYQEALTKLRIADEAHYGEGFKAGRAMKKNDGKNAFEAGMEKGKRDTEKKHEQEINHLQLALKQAGKNYLDLRQEYTDTLEKAKEKHAAEVLGLTYKNEQALEVKWREGYREGKAVSDKVIEETYANGLRAGKMQKVHAIVDEARSRGYQNGLKDGYYNGLQAAAKAVDTKILAVTCKEPALGGIPRGDQATASRVTKAPNDFFANVLGTKP